MYTGGAWLVALIAVPYFVCIGVKSANQSVEIATRIGCNFIGLIVVQLICLFVVHDLEMTWAVRSLALDPNREYPPFQDLTAEQNAVLRQMTNDASNVFAPMIIVAISLLHSLAFGLITLCNQLLRSRKEY